MKCMYAQTRPRFILSSEGVFGGMEFEPMLTPREKSPLPKMSPEEDRTRDAVDSEPKHYQLSYSGPPVTYMTQLALPYNHFMLNCRVVRAMLIGQRSPSPPPPTNPPSKNHRAFAMAFFSRNIRPMKYRQDYYFQKSLVGVRNSSVIVCWARCAA